MLTDLLNALNGLTPTHWIATAALAVSVASLWVSVLNYRRDRPKLKIAARLFRWDGEPGAGPGWIEVKVINVGRRPVFLTMLWGRGAGGEGSGAFLDYGGLGIKLSEHETKVLNVTHLPRGSDDHAAVAMGADDIIEFNRLWIEDSTGKRRSVPGAKRLLKDLSEDYSRWCKETGYWKPQPPRSVASDSVPAASGDQAGPP